MNLDANYNMSRTIARYTIGQLMELNQGQHLESGTVRALFDQYPAPQTNLNPHNIYIKNKDKPAAPPSSKPASQLLQQHQADAYSDERILDDIKQKVFVCISKGEGKVAKALARMNNLVIPATQTKAIADLFHKSMIECNFLIDEYLIVLLHFTNANPEVASQIHRDFMIKVVTEFKSPQKFKDSRTESGLDRGRRWRLNNAIILAKLYTNQLPEQCQFLRQALNTDKFCTNFLDQVFAGVKSNDSWSFELLVAVWGIVSQSPRLSTESPTQYQSYLTQLQTMSTNSQFQLSDRVRLMNLL